MKSLEAIFDTFVIFGVMLFALSDVAWQTVVGGVVAVLLGYMQFMTKAAADSAAKSAAKSADVTVMAVANVKELKETTHATYKLVNSGSLIAAELHLLTCKRLAEITKDERDVTAVENAEKAVTDHKAKMAKEESERITDKENAQHVAEIKAENPPTV